MEGSSVDCGITGAGAATAPLGSRGEVGARRLPFAKVEMGDALAPEVGGEKRGAVGGEGEAGRNAALAGFAQLVADWLVELSVGEMESVNHLPGGAGAEKAGTVRKKDESVKGLIDLGARGDFGGSEVDDGLVGI